MIIESIYLLDITEYSGELEKLRHDDSGLILKINLKNALTKKLRLKLSEYFQGKYLYLLSNWGLTMKYKKYNISKRKEIASSVR